MFKVGDKVVMNRECSVFKQIVKKNSVTGSWWNEMEEVHPLVILKVEEFSEPNGDYCQQLEFENSEYKAMDKWVKEYMEEGD